MSFLDTPIASKALVIIDMQSWFLDDASDKDNASEVIKEIGLRIEQAKTQNERIFFVTYGEESSITALTEKVKDYSLLSNIVKNGDSGAIEIDKEIQLINAKLQPFEPPISSLLVCGLNTNACVYRTVQDLACKSTYPWSDCAEIVSLKGRYNIIIGPCMSIKDTPSSKLNHLNGLKSMALCIPHLVSEFPDVNLIDPEFVAFKDFLLEDYNPYYERSYSDLTNVQTAYRNLASILDNLEGDFLSQIDKKLQFYQSHNEIGKICDVFEQISIIAPSNIELVTFLKEHYYGKVNENVNKFDHLN